MGGASAPEGGGRDDAPPNPPVTCPTPKGHLYRHEVVETSECSLCFPGCDYGHYGHSTERGRSVHVEVYYEFYKTNHMTQWGYISLLSPDWFHSMDRRQHLPPPTTLLTMEFDSQLVRGPSEGNTTGGGGAGERGAAEENISTKCRFSYWVAQRREPLAAIDTLVWQGPMEGAAVADRLGWWRFLPVLQKRYGWRRYNHNIISSVLLGFIYFKQPPAFISRCHLPLKMPFFSQDSPKRQMIYLVLVSAWLRRTVWSTVSFHIFLYSRFGMWLGGVHIPKRGPSCRGRNNLQSTLSWRLSKNQTWKQPEDEFTIICYTYTVINRRIILNNHQLYPSDLTEWLSWQIAFSYWITIKP